MHKFVIRGTRGSMPACGHDFLKYGGNTTCFTLETDEGLLIFDAGTGITSLNQQLCARDELPDMTICFTHFHLDHLLGLPCFAPLYDPRAKIRLMGDPMRKDNWRGALKSLITTPYWPMDLATLHPDSAFQNLPSQTGTMEIYGVRVSWCPVSHPQGCLAYKVEGPDSTIVIATDHEHAESDVSAGFLEFCRGVDCLIYDAMYTPEEYLARLGWGHGNWQQGVQLAMEAGAGELILSHHDYTRTDHEIDEIVKVSQQFFKNTRAATEQMVLSH